MRSNKKDFENALNSLESTLRNIYHEISAGDYDVIETVIREYNDHYKADINEVLNNLETIEDSLYQKNRENEDLQSKNEDMENIIYQLEEEVEDLQSNNEDMENIIYQLEEKVEDLNSTS